MRYMKNYQRKKTLNSNTIIYAHTLTTVKTLVSRYTAEAVTRNDVTSLLLTPPGTLLVTHFSIVPIPNAPYFKQKYFE
jgi:hypothetical protein